MYLAIFLIVPPWQGACGQLLHRWLTFAFQLLYQERITPSHTLSYLQCTLASVSVKTQPNGTVYFLSSKHKCSRVNVEEDSHRFFFSVILKEELLGFMC